MKNEIFKPDSKDFIINDLGLEIAQLKVNLAETKFFLNEKSDIAEKQSKEIEFLKRFIESDPDSSKKFKTLMKEKENLDG